MLHRRFGVGLAGLTGVVLAAAGPARAEEGHRALRAAVYEMREAKKELEDRRFERHRKDAVHDLDVAIEETERALKAAKADLRYEPPRDLRYERTFPHLRRALVDLHEAKKELEGERDEHWGGRRKEAVRAVEVAINRLDEVMKEVK